MKRILLDITEVIEKVHNALDEELERSKWRQTPRLLALSVELDKLRTAHAKQIALARAR